jgi:hypothetical protein
MAYYNIGSVGIGGSGGGPPPAGTGKPLVIFEQTLSPINIANEQFNLPNNVFGGRVWLTVAGAGSYFSQGVDFTLVGSNVIDWSGGGLLQTNLAVGDKIQVIYPEDA